MLSQLKKIGFAGALLMLSGLLAGGVHATEDVPLSAAQVENFIRSMENYAAVEEQMESLGASGDEKLLDEDYELSDLADFSSFAMGMMHAQGTAAYELLDGHAREHGFDGVAGWAAAGGRIFRATMALYMEESKVELEQEIQRMRQELADNPALAEAQIEQLTAMAGFGMQLMESLAQGAEEDIDVVRPYLEQLKTVMDD